MPVFDADDYLEHFGTPRHSGRYPYGSGGDNDHFVLPRSATFLDQVEAMRKKDGLSEKEIAVGLGLKSTGELRAKKTQAKAEVKLAQIAYAQKLKDKGVSDNVASEKMGLPESTYRTLLKPGAEDRAKALTATSEMLKKLVDEKEYLDVGAGVEGSLGISKEKLTASLAILKDQGYSVHQVNSQQVGTGFDTRYKVLVKPGVTQKDAWMNRGKIQQIREFSEDGGHTYGKPLNPIKIDPKRVKVVYGPEGGADKDGVLYVRRGVEDVSLGKARYAQVRVAVGNDHYIKGMAMYHDDMPKGVDIMFHTNKSDTGNKMDALKKINHDDPSLPFEAIVRQIGHNIGTPKEKVTSSMNIVNEEGQWINWSKNVSPQVLSKQNPSVARDQLDATFKHRKQEFDEIMSLTNPTVKKKLLEDFSEGVDAAAVHLKAARLPRQNWHVILPITTISPHEVYAPNYENGERVALIRYPHGGKFEIPDLVVNNRHRDSRRALADAPDAIGIHPKVAERMSGADFDGDTVLVIPNSKGRIKSEPALAALKGFDPKTLYRLDESTPKLKPQREQQLMGDVSNLITDMTLKGASNDKLARAVKHSMVVIDARKHHLDYKRSALDNGIKALKEEYQGGARRGASTLISRQGSEAHLPERKARLHANGGPIDPKTGRKMHEPTNKTRVDKFGNRVLKTRGYNKLADATDAHSLSSGTRMESIYAEHSNRLKDLANQARLQSLKTKAITRSPSAAKVYAEQVATLKGKLADSKANAPLERQAQIFANNEVRAKRQARPDLDDKQLKKIKYQALEAARARTGAHKTRVKISKEEWDAIQHGAISNSMLTEILRDADMDVVRAHATPRTQLKMTASKTTKAIGLLAQGYDRGEVAAMLGVSLTTLDAATNETGAYD